MSCRNSPNETQNTFTETTSRRLESVTLDMDPGGLSQTLQEWRIQSRPLHRVWAFPLPAPSLRMFSRPRAVRVRRDKFLGNFPRCLGNFPVNPSNARVAHSQRASCSGGQQSFCDPTRCRIPVKAPRTRIGCRYSLCVSGFHQLRDSYSPGRTRQGEGRGRVGGSHGSDGTGEYSLHLLIRLRLSTGPVPRAGLAHRIPRRYSLMHRRPTQVIPG